MKHFADLLKHGFTLPDVFGVTMKEEENLVLPAVAVSKVKARNASSALRDKQQTSFPQVAVWETRRAIAWFRSWEK